MAGDPTCNIVCKKHSHQDIFLFATALARELVLAMGLMFDKGQHKLRLFQTNDGGTVEILAMVSFVLMTKRCFEASMSHIYSFDLVIPLILRL